MRPRHNDRGDNRGFVPSVHTLSASMRPRHNDRGDHLFYHHLHPYRNRLKGGPGTMTGEIGGNDRKINSSAEVQWGPGKKTGEIGGAMKFAGMVAGRKGGL